MSLTKQVAAVYKTLPARLPGPESINISRMTILKAEKG